MSNTDVQPIARLTFDAATLMREHPPRLRDRNKQIVFRRACPPGCTITGTIVYTRWHAMPLPGDLDPARPLPVEAREDKYDYLPARIAGPVADWHVNFADPRLFFGYGSRLFAQDEIQAAEHPVLGSLLEALHAAGQVAMTVDQNGPTPVLVLGAERRVSIATDADAGEGRPYGLYGNQFSDADVATVERAVTALVPPTFSNLIAIAAPRGGMGAYKRQEIENILVTAYTGFRAACLESAQAAGPNASTIVRTGFWGCGAFGGNRVLMALLQLIAAQAASIDRVIFHCASAAGTARFAVALDMFQDWVSNERIFSVQELIDLIFAESFQWGYGDGN